VKEVDEFYCAGKIGFLKAPIEILEEAALQEVMGKYGLSTRNMPFTDDFKKVLLAKAY